MADEAPKDYRVIDGQTYSNALLVAADNAQHKGADGIIGVEDAKFIVEAKVSDADVKNRTIAYIREHYKLAKETDQLFQASSPKEKAKSKKSRSKAAEKPLPPPRSDKPQRKRKVSSKLLEAQEDEEASKHPSKFEREDETKKKRRKKGTAAKKGPLYCVCRKPYNPRLPMVGCDSCDEWYHLKCVEMSQEDADAVESYKCDRCQRGEPPLRELDAAEADQEADEDAEQDLEEAEPDDEHPRRAAPAKKKTARMAPRQAANFAAAAPAYTGAAPQAGQYVPDEEHDIDDHAGGGGGDGLEDEGDYPEG